MYFQNVWACMSVRVRVFNRELDVSFTEETKCAQNQLRHTCRVWTLSFSQKALALIFNVIVINNKYYYVLVYKFNKALVLKKMYLLICVSVYLIYSSYIQAEYYLCWIVSNEDNEEKKKNIV